ncbi:acetyl CoA carboxylase, BCCP subunit [Thiomonas sp. X19]|uniref:acetyl-CoA carboxylase biotin carboxyl carrier protein n=1 Tax=Thiomonas sp. X19 TaxID=1050370 RepID=UPI000B6F85EA|nr:acetyl-CoA carboxylase biotin carboxyl carrier protein [Thiomonas sp. X19]SCC92720.1 acetyl CoA carboxylase, BCCP subunit [Thiomonas sp. X19]
MDLRKLKTLVDLVSESNISELEITEAEGKVRIVKTPPVLAQQAPVQYIAAPMSAQQGAPMAPATGIAEAAASVPPAPSGKLIKSPMVGTFYRSSAPGAKPFVEVGDTVKQGQAVCIVEAMKILNEIESDIDGVVKEILVDNGQAVEYGQPLFVLE